VRLVLLFFLLLSVPAEAAKPSAVPNRFGAIAYHRESQSWGVAFDKPRARDAALEALKQCNHQRCEVVHRFKNGCAALVDGAKAAFGASGATRDEAETRALRRCAVGSTPGSERCKPVAWACTR
jgi:hypothetical protein